MKKEQSKKKNTKPSLNNFSHLPILKKPTKDYGKVIVDALKRAKHD